MNPRTETIADDDLFEQAAAEFTARLRSGERPTIEEFCARYSEVADILRELLPTIAAVERTKDSTVDALGGGAIAPQKAPERLGDYRILRLLGQGGMGIVYEAVQESLNRRVAVKVLPAQALMEEKRVKRFEQEARLAAQLYHPNIVPVFGVGHEAGLHYYVMQLIDGEGLDRRIRQLPDNCLPARQAAEIARDASRALHYAHTQGTLHRDVKPSNLLIDRNGSVWLADFGLAQALESSSSVSAQLGGTLRYLPPERFQGISDARGDVYGMGVTLYEILCGKPPFDAGTGVELMRQITQAEPTAPRRLNPRLPRDLEIIVLKATARDPRHRYQTAEELADDLDRFLGGLPIRARRISIVERGWRWCRRNRLVAAALALAVTSFGLLFTVVAVSGYQTSQLNDELTGSLSRERTSREMAEKMSTTALEALDKVFSRLAPAGVMSAAASVDELDDDEAGDIAAAGAVSPQVAAALEDLLPYYVKLAEQRGNDSQALYQAAMAKYRVGLIQARLGRLDEARDSWPQAANLMAELRKTSQSSSQGAELALSIAALECDRGDWERLHDHFREAHEAYDRALKAFDGLAPEALSFESRRELARVHLALGTHDHDEAKLADEGPGGPRHHDQRPPPPREGGRGGRGRGEPRPGSPRPDEPRPGEGPQDEPGGLPEFGGPPPPGGPGGFGAPPPFGEPGGRPGEHRGPPHHGEPGGRHGPPPREHGGDAKTREYLNLALTELKQLITERPKDAQTRLLLARCYRELPPAHGEPRVESANLLAAEKLLRELVAENPKSPDYSFELSETLVDFHTGMLQPHEFKKAAERLHAGLQISDQLLAEHPETWLYAAARVHIFHRLMSVEQRMGNSELAEQAARQALELEGKLISRFPEVLAYAVWQARIQSGLAVILVEQGKRDEAVKLLADAQDTLKPHFSGKKPPRALSDARDMIERQQKQLGK